MSRIGVCNLLRVGRCVARVLRARFAEEGEEDLANDRAYAMHMHVCTVHTVVLISISNVLGRANDCDTGAIAVDQIGRRANGEKVEGREGREERESASQAERRRCIVNSMTDFTSDRLGCSASDGRSAQPNRHVVSKPEIKLARSRSLQRER